MKTKKLVGDVELRKTRGPRLGLIIDNLYAPLHRDIFEGACTHSERTGKESIAFCGGALKDPLHLNRMRNHLYDNVSTSLFDALVIPLSPVARRVSLEDRAAFLARFSGVPIVNVGPAVEGITSVGPDYRSGMKDLVRHLIRVHGRRKILLLRGPENNLSSNEREAAFRETLEEEGIPFDRNYVVMTELRPTDGAAAVAEILSSRRIVFDALITTNDKVALKAMETLIQAGVRVPEDVSVAGYQGIPQGVLSKPSLTTVDERTRYQGEIASGLAWDLVDGIEVPPVTLVPTRLIIRESCGCKKDQTPAIDEFKNQFLATREENESAEEYFTRTSLQSESIFSLFNNFGFSTISKLDLNAMLLQVHQSLGIKNCFIVLYATKKPPYTQARLFGALRDDKIIQLEANEPFFPVRELLPPGMMPSGAGLNLIVLPLFSGENNHGYLVIQRAIEEGMAYEALFSQISTALHNTFQLENLRSAHKRFSDMATIASDWLWEIDQNGLFTWSSDGSIALLGYGDEDILGRNLFDLLSPEEKEFKEQLQKDVFPSNGVVKSLEAWFSRKDGQTVCLQMNALPVFESSSGLAGYRGSFRDVTGQKLTERKISHMAFYDNLTGLPNRILLRDRLDLALAAARRGQHFMALFFIDLDHFKGINDTYGHETGDEFLKQVSSRARSCLREGDTLARLGGDEFVVLLPFVKSLDVCSIVARKIISSLNETPAVVGEVSFPITLSLGIAVFPTDGDNGEELLRHADAAMYRAKESGRNRAVFYQRDLDINNRPASTPPVTK